MLQRPPNPSHVLEVVGIFSLSETPANNFAKCCRLHEISSGGASFWSQVHTLQVGFSEIPLSCTTLGNRRRVSIRAHQGSVVGEAKKILAGAAQTLRTPPPPGGPWPKPERSAGRLPRRGRQSGPHLCRAEHQRHAVPVLGGRAGPGHRGHLGHAAVPEASQWSKVGRFPFVPPEGGGVPP